MKKTDYIKFTLDLLMGIIFAFLFNKTVFGGMAFHEIAGLAIGFAVIIHLILNLKWIKNVTSAILKKETPIKTKIGYVVNLLLLLDILTIIISGICISKVVFSNFNLHNNIFDKNTHTAAAYTALLLIGIHVGLHWNWVMNTFKNIVKINTQNKAFDYASKLAAVLILVFGLYNIVTVNYFSKLLIVSNFVSSGPSGNGSNFMPQDGNGGPQGNAPSEGFDQDGSSSSNGKQQSGTAPSARQQQSSNSSSDTQQNDSAANSQQLNVANGNNPQGMQQGKGSPNLHGGGKGMPGGRGSENSNIFSILSIMGTFAVITYYIQTLTMIIKKRKSDIH